MNSFYWFHLLFLFILLLPVLSFLFTLRKPLRRNHNLPWNLPPLCPKSPVISHNFSCIFSQICAFFLYDKINPSHRRIRPRGFGENSRPPGKALCSPPQMV